MKYSFNQNFELKKGNLIYKFPYIKTKGDNTSPCDVGEKTIEGTATISVWQHEFVYFNDGDNPVFDYKIYVRVRDTVSGNLFKDGVELKEKYEGDLFKKFIELKK